MPTFLFDLDGTLCDSRPGLVRSFQAAFSELDIKEERFDRFLGTPLPEAFRSVVPTIGDDDIQRGISAFRRTYESAGMFETPLYPGAVELLNAIRCDGCSVWLVTSKPQKYADRVLEFLNIRPYFHGVIGASLDERDTKTTLIKKALFVSRSAPSHCVMLGDRSYDVVGALENHVQPVGALWGYGSRTELEQAGCSAFCVDLYEFKNRYTGSSSFYSAPRLRRIHKREKNMPHGTIGH